MSPMALPDRVARAGRAGRVGRDMPTADPDDMARDLVGRLTGPVVELGPGATPSARWLDLGVAWTGVEPDAARLAQCVDVLRPGDRLLRGVAEALPMSSGTVGGVVGRRVLCSVRDPAAVLDEVRRVLVPGGRYVFVEHVAAAPGSWRRYVQKAYSARVRAGRGCRVGLDTARLIVAAGFDYVEFTSHVVRGPWGVGVDVVVGAAATTRSAPSGRW